MSTLSLTSSDGEASPVVPEALTEDRLNRGDIVVAMLLGVSVCFSFTMVMMWYKYQCPCQKGPEEDDDAEAPTLTREQIKERRLRYIEAWLVNKTALRHDEICDKVCVAKEQYRRQRMRAKERSSTMETVQSTMILDDEPGIECAICMDALVEGDVVSWSVASQCGHFFHHSCIKVCFVGFVQQCS